MKRARSYTLPSPSCRHREQLTKGRSHTARQRSSAKPRTPVKTRASRRRFRQADTSPPPEAPVPLPSLLRPRTSAREGLILSRRSLMRHEPPELLAPPDIPAQSPPRASARTPFASFLLLPHRPE